MLGGCRPMLSGYRRALDHGTDDVVVWLRGYPGGRRAAVSNTELPAGWNRRIRARLATG